MENTLKITVYMKDLVEMMNYKEKVIQYRIKRKYLKNTQIKIILKI